MSRLHGTLSPSLESFNPLEMDRIEVLLKVPFHRAAERIERAFDVRSDITVYLFVLGLHTGEKMLDTGAHVVKTVRMRVRPPSLHPCAGPIRTDAP